MLEQRDAGLSYAEIGRQAYSLGVKDGYRNPPSAGVVAMVIRRKLQERMSAVSAAKDALNTYILMAEKVFTGKRYEAIIVEQRP